jgi:hypothetical protein
MGSKQRLEANRTNAKRSTGPCTQTGKARSKMNALKHGLAAKSVVIEGETRASSRPCERVFNETLMLKL